ncbi:hypothetical protein [Sphingobacterium corticibacterium]|uniref:hypothetical protein n=1 Tax=Sphingobacterium corticibacterium TaxID=2484746 RepID=UPI0013EE456A|nr:hypothetical protein [Sphingobacterium corticibacterium]
MDDPKSRLFTIASTSICKVVYSNQKNVERQNLIHHSSKGIFAIRQGKWKFIDSDGGGGWSNIKEETPGQLYNLEEDIEERVNLYDKYPDIVKELKTNLEQIKEQGYSIIHEKNDHEKKNYRYYH